MIYQVIYSDAHGDVLFEATFSADDPINALEILTSTPGLEPPAATETVNVRCIGDE